MQQAPTAQGMSEEQIKERIHQINEALIVLKQGGINSASAISPDNKESDDSGSEAAMDQATLGQISQEINDLERERAELEAKLKD